MFLCSHILAVICIAHVNQAYNTLGTRELSLIMIMPVLQNVQCKRNMEKKPKNQIKNDTKLYIKLKLNIKHKLTGPQFLLRQQNPLGYWQQTERLKDDHLQKIMAGNVLFNGQEQYKY